MITTPVLDPVRLYLAYDRHVCGRVECAGMTAIYTGVTTGGSPIVPVDPTYVDYWRTLDLGPLTCECGAVVVP